MSSIIEEIISESAKSERYLRSSRDAVLARGGEISTTAGLKDLPDAIYNIPADSSLAFPSDDSVAYRKVVPVGVESMARVTELGGMTYKCNNLAKIRGWSANAINFNNSPLVLTNGYGTTISTTEAVDSITVTQSSAENTSNPTSYYNGYFCFALANRLTNGQRYRLSFDVTLNSNPLNAGYFILFVNGIGQNEWIPSDTSTFPSVGETKRISAVFTYTVRETEPEANYIEVRNSGANLVISNVMITEEAITDTTYEPYFEGLRSAKVTSLKSEGANLIPFPYFKMSEEKYGITYTANDDGGITISGTATETYSFQFAKDLKISDNATVTLSGGVLASSTTDKIIVTARKLLADGTRSNFLDSPKGDNPTETGYLAEGESIYTIQTYIPAGSTVNATIYPMLNYGTEAAPYAPYKSEPLDTLTIPEAVQSLDGYGLGVNSEYFNYIDYSRKVFVQRVRAVDMGTLTYQYRVSNNRHIFRVGLNGIQGQISPNIPINAIAADYNAVSCNATWANRDMAYGNDPIGYQIVEIVDNRYTDIETFKSAVTGKMLVYALAEPIETDISGILPTSGFLKVEGGGAVTFENEYGYSVPSDIMYVKVI